jgi:TorA maturation chaperone TorD
LSDAAPLSARALEDEDIARASWYGLIGRLFYAPPDPNLLAEIGRSGQGGPADGSALMAAWRDVQQVCRSAYPAVVRQEYDSLFVGTGRSEVSPYLSGYAEAMAPDRFLVMLREQLAAWGLARREGAGEVEDHISGIADVMRWLIENQRSLAEQQQFFENFAYRGAIAFCAALQKSASANFYKPVAALASSYFDIERAAFEMSETARESSS